MGIVNAFNIPKYIHIFDYCKHLEIQICTQKCYYTMARQNLPPHRETQFILGQIVFSGCILICISISLISCYNSNAVLILNFVLILYKGRRGRRDNDLLQMTFYELNEVTYETVTSIMTDTW